MTCLTWDRYTQRCCGRTIPATSKGIETRKNVPAAGNYLPRRAKELKPIQNVEYMLIRNTILGYMMTHHIPESCVIMHNSARLYVIEHNNVRQPMIIHDNTSYTNTQKIKDNMQQYTIRLGMRCSPPISSSRFPLLSFLCSSGTRCFPP